MASRTASRPADDQRVGARLVAARARLKRAGIQTAWLDAEVLLAHLLGTTRERLLAHPEDRMTARELRGYAALVGRRAKRVPIAYLTGTREFYGMPLTVSAAVLIPRPETELLVELAVDWLRAHPDRHRVIDLGTGSGAIAIAIARSSRAARIVAIDRDQRTLAVARGNMARQRVASRVRLLKSDLLSRAPVCDLLVANLPYLSAARRRAWERDLMYEPIRALDGGPDGLDLIRRTLEQAPAKIQPSGALFLECDPGQPRRITALALRQWPLAAVRVHRDLAGRDRVVEIQLP
jgi:release factor glutamine methyltransferase